MVIRRWIYEERQKNNFTIYSIGACNNNRVLFCILQSIADVSFISGHGTSIAGLMVAQEKGI